MRTHNRRIFLICVSTHKHKLSRNINILWYLTRRRTRKPSQKLQTVTDQMPTPTCAPKTSHSKQTLPWKALLLLGFKHTHTHTKQTSACTMLTCTRMDTINTITQTSRHKRKHRLLCTHTLIAEPTYTALGRAHSKTQERSCTIGPGLQVHSHNKPELKRMRTHARTVLSQAQADTHTRKTQTSPTCAVTIIISPNTKPTGAQSHQGGVPLTWGTLCRSHLSLSKMEKCLTGDSPRDG